jgi:hypothetical protein
MSLTPQKKREIAQKVAQDAIDNIEFSDVYEDEALAEIPETELEEIWEMARHAEVSVWT